MDYLQLKYYNADNELRPYQKENKNKVYEAWETYRSVMLQMPTGTGKTRTFVSIMSDIYNYSVAEKHAYKVLVLVHRKELLDQIYDEITLYLGKACGIIMAGEREHKKIPFQIASVQTLNNRLVKWADKQFDFIIIDEAHHTTAESYQRIIKTFPNAKLLGVTATPCRLSGEGFTNTFEKLLLSPPISWFIDNGYLSNYVYGSVTKYSRIKHDIDGIKKFSNGDYAEQEMERVCDNDRIRAQVVDSYLKYANGKKGIVYTINKTHNKNLCGKFLSQGISAVAIDCDTPKEMREEYIEDFKKGNIQIICNVNLFTEGFDCPDIEFVQLARPTKSLSLYLQQVGRGLRTSANKEKTIILDNVGLYYKFGFPKAHRHWQRHFEGRIDDMDAEIEGNEKKKEKLSIENGTRRTRHQNLEEGYEEVFLIQDEDDRGYVLQRTELLWHLFDELNGNYVSVCNEVFSSGEYEKLGFVITNEFMETMYYYNLKIVKETDLFQQRLAKATCRFIEIDDVGNEVTNEDRHYRDSNELTSLLSNSFNWECSKRMKSIVKDFAFKIKDANFIKEELLEIIPLLAGREFCKCPSHYTGTKNVVPSKIPYMLWEYWSSKWISTFVSDFFSALVTLFFIMLKENRSEEFPSIYDKQFVRLIIKNYDR